MVGISAAISSRVEKGESVTSRSEEEVEGIDGVGGLLTLVLVGD